MTGILISLTLMAEACFGYLLPFGQKPYTGTQVSVNRFAAIPIVGGGLSNRIRGDYVVADATLDRLFAYRVIAPLILLVLVAAFIVALHEVGSNGPDGQIKATKDARNVRPTGRVAG